METLRIREIRKGQGGNNRRACYREGKLYSIAKRETEFNYSQHR